MDSRLHLAARNNAAWCDTVCRANGTPGEFRDSIWLNRHAVPAFYPNAVTLTDGQATDVQRAGLRDLMAANIPTRWAVKDSFSTLDLSSCGFSLLFDADWYFRPPAPDGVCTADQWTRLRSAEALAQWEAAWGADAGLAAGTRIFPDALIANPDIAFLARYAGARIVAGAIANRHAGAVGLSNVFGPPREDAATRAAGVALASTQFPSLPVVGYESAEKRDAMTQLGFASIGALRVWQRLAL
jgi:hypothetical protein